MSSGLGCLGLLAVLIAGCGTIGPPIAPEDVGVAPLIERQKKLQAQPTEAGQAPLDSKQTEGPESSEPVGQDQELPSLRPVGGR